MTDMGGIFEEFLTGTDPVQAGDRGDLLQGIVIAVDPNGLIVDLGLKRDGIVPQSDLDKLPSDDADLKIGDEIAVMVVDPVDHDGNMIVSISHARESTDWLRAKRIMESDEIIEAEVNQYNRGGLLVPFGRLLGFIPASHLSDLPRSLDDQGREKFFSDMIGKTLPLKIIEVDPQRRRLVFSERKAIREWRQNRKAEVIQTLKQGEIRTGVVTSLREFGAFVDIGGADGLIHISELSWRRIENPADILQVGQEVETLVIRLDPATNRIGLSLKRLEPSPWEALDERLSEGQVLEGTVTCFSSAGVFVLVDENLEGLLRLAEGPSELNVGSKLQVQVASIDVENEKLDLDLVEIDQVM